MSSYPHQEEEALYEQIAQEILRGDIRQGLWLKATVDADGNDGRARVLYTRLRIAQVKGEAQWVHEAANLKARLVRERFVHALAEKGFALSGENGAWVLYLPHGDAIRFSSFEECCRYCEGAVGISVD